MNNNSVYKFPPQYTEEGIPVFSETGDEYNRNYEKISNDHINTLAQTDKNPFIPESLWTESENATASLIKKYSKKGDKILDVGVGLGRLMYRFPELDRYGMDISFGYLKIAHQKGINCCYARVEDMPYKEETFDVITCTDVLEHVLDLNIAIRCILKVLKKKGIFIVRVPYRENLSGYLDPNYPYYYVHLRNFDENNISLLFTRVFNLEVLEWSTCGNFPDISKMKHPYPNSRICKSILYRYHQLLKKLKPSSYAKLFYHHEINVVAIKL